MPGSNKSFQERFQGISRQFPVLGRILAYHDLAMDSTVKDEQRQCLNEIISLKPYLKNNGTSQDKVRYYNTLALFYYSGMGSDKNFVLAETYTRQAQVLAPENQVLMSNLGNIYIEKSKSDDVTRDESLAQAKGWHLLRLLHGENKNSLSALKTICSGETCENIDAMALSLLDACADAKANPDRVVFDAIRKKLKSLNKSYVEQRLAQPGSNLDAPLPDGRLPLHAMIEDGHIHMVKALLDQGASRDLVESQYQGTVLHTAAKCGNPEMLNLLLSTTLRESIERRNSYGCTPLQMAVWANNRSTVIALLLAGANINAQSKHGNTALHFAMSENHIDLVMLLLLHDADVGIVNQEGKKAYEIDTGSKSVFVLIHEKNQNAIVRINAMSQSHRAKTSDQPLSSDKAEALDKLRDIIADNLYRPLCANVAAWKVLEEGRYDAKVREHADMPWIQGALGLATTTSALVDELGNNERYRQYLPHNAAASSTSALSSSRDPIDVSRGSWGQPGSRLFQPAIPTGSSSVSLYDPNNLMNNLSTVMGGSAIHIGCHGFH